MTAWWTVWLVARREMLSRMRSRAFQISTAVLVVLVIGGTSTGRWAPSFFDDGPQRVGLLPEAAPLGNGIRTLAAALDLEVDVVELSPGDDLKAAMEREDLDAILVSPGRLAFNTSPDSALQAIVAQASFDFALPGRAEALGLTVEQARELIQPFPVAVEVLSPSDEGRLESYGLVSITAIILLVAMSQYGQWVLVGVIEEKSNRVVEVLLAVVAPWQLLTGKVLGIMALALTQIGAALAAVGVSLVAFEGATLPESGATAITLAVGWLLLGLVLYNFFYAAVGATATRPEDASSAMAPVLAPLMIGYFAALTYVPDNPDALASRVLSIFPLTSPLVMPARVVAGGGSAVEMVIAVTVMLFAIAGTIWLAGRIYAGAILQTQRVSLLNAVLRLRSK